MVTIERLDDSGLLELFGHADPLGVLSVYVNADPTRDPHLQAAAIELKNRFRELQRRVAEAGADRDRAAAAALERVWPRIEALADPTTSGRARIAFAALDSGEVMQLASAMPVADRVVWDDGPFIHPLLELLDEGRPAGVVLASAEEARLLEWRVGVLRQLSRIEDPHVQAPHERAGQIGGGPRGQFNSPVREQRQSRGRDRAERFLDQVVAVTEDLSAARGWERILVSGGDRWTEPVIAGFGQALRDKVFADSRVLTGLDDAALTSAVTGWAREQHTERERHLLTEVRDAAGSGRGVLGLSEVAAALNAGRVRHLVYDPDIRYTGTVGADGALYSGDEVAPGGSPGTPEPRLTERLVHCAIATGARISPVEGGGAGALKDAAGIAALLRW